MRPIQVIKWVFHQESLRKWYLKFSNFIKINIIKSIRKKLFNNTNKNWLIWKTKTKPKIPLLNQFNPSLKSLKNNHYKKFQKKSLKILKMISRIKKVINKLPCCQLVLIMEEKLINIYGAKEFEMWQSLFSLIEN